MDDKNKTPGNGNTPKPGTTVAVIDKNISDKIFSKVNELEQSGGLQIPANYSVGNALKSAWLILQNTVDKERKPVLDVCTKDSIANALLDMVIQGLSPAKKQCYFIAYGKHLAMTPSYLGKIVATKRIKVVKDVFANCIYQGDEFEYVFDLETGLKRITKHTQQFTNIDTAKIVGAYAVVLRQDLPPFVEIMNIAQIRASWEQGAAKGNSDAHKKFSDEMAKKTVISRACKTFWNTSDDSDLLIESLNRTTALDNIPDTPYIEESIEKEVAENANQQLIDIQSELPAEQSVEQTEQHPAAKSNGELKSEDWESPILILEKIDSFTDYKTILQFSIDNEKRIDTIGGREGESIKKALRTKMDNLREATKSTQTIKSGKKEPF